MSMPQIGDILAYHPTSDFLAFQGIALGENLAEGVWPQYVHVGIYAGENKQISSFTDVGTGEGQVWKFPFDIIRPEYVPGELNKVLAYAKSRYGKSPYGWADVFLSGLARMMHANKFNLPALKCLPPDCAAFVTQALRAGGIDPFPELLFSWEVIPDDFKHAKWMKVVS